MHCLKELDYDDEEEELTMNDQSEEGTAVDYDSQGEVTDFAARNAVASANQHHQTSMMTAQICQKTSPL